MLLAPFYGTSSYLKWKTYIKLLDSQLEGKKIKFPDPYIFRQKWAAQTWERLLPIHTTPQGDSIAEATRILNKWSPWLDANYSPPITGKRQDFIGSWEYKIQGTGCHMETHPPPRWQTMEKMEWFHMEISGQQNPALP